MIFTGLRIKGVYDKKKARAIETNEYVFNPVIGEASCQLTAHETNASDSEKHKLEEKLEAIRDLLHETRSLNGQIRDEDNNVLDVTISSIGPYCDDNEILHLCDKGFRGENAKGVDNTGQGFGLNFAKKFVTHIILGLHLIVNIFIKTMELNMESLVLSCILIITCNAAIEFGFCHNTYTI